MKRTVKIMRGKAYEVYLSKSGKNTQSRKYYCEDVADGVVCADK